MDKKLLKISYDVGVKDECFIKEDVEKVLIKALKDEYTLIQTGFHFAKHERTLIFEEK